MSDKTYWLNKLIKRQYAKGDFLRADGGGTPTWSSTVTVIAVAVIVFGLFQYFTQGMELLWLIVTIVGAVATAFSIIYGQVKAKTAFTEFTYRHNGKDITVQYIGKKHIVFACDGIIFEFKNREVNRVESLYRPQYTMSAITEVLYTSRMRKADTVIHYGETEEEIDGKKKIFRYKVKLNNDNKMESYNVNGTEITFSYVKKGEIRLALPLNMINAIRDAGIDIPGDDVIQIVHNY